MAITASSLRARPSPLEWLRLRVGAAKPRIVALFVVTALATLALGRSLGSVSVIPVLAGVAATVAGAGILNNCFDSDMDRRMARTRGRATASGVVACRNLYVSACLLVGVGTVLLAVFGGPLSAALAVAGSLYYGLLYTLFLKRRLAMSTLPGSLAGVFPVLIAWAATGRPWSAEVLVLSAYIALWSAPHFWSLALALEHEYAAARVPTPVQRYGRPATRLFITAAIVLLVPIGLVPWMLGRCGPLYLVLFGSAAVAFIAGGAALWLHPGRQSAWRLYKLSGPHLALVMFAMAVGIDPGFTG